MRKFVMGDLHGAHKALVQCLDRASFDYSKDLLICLGDVCDGFPEVPACMDELLKIRHLVFVLGNHDQWFRQWATKGILSELWLYQGGRKTVETYQGRPNPRHVQLLESACRYFLLDKMVFVHGGLEPGIPMTEQDDHTLFWDRKLVIEANAHKDQKISISGYEKVFVGHTPTIRFKSMVPVRFCEVTLMDTGAGWGQKLSVMDLDTLEVFQSDTTNSLYGVSFTR